MECPKCESKALVMEKKTYRHLSGDPVVEVRVYACTNLDCLHAFAYRNTFLKDAELRDVARFLKRYERAQQDKKTGQTKLELED